MLSFNDPDVIASIDIAIADVELYDGNLHWRYEIVQPEGKLMWLVCSHHMYMESAVFPIHVISDTRSNPPYERFAAYRAPRTEIRVAGDDDEMYDVIMAIYDYIENEHDWRS